MSDKELIAAVAARVAAVEAKAERDLMYDCLDSDAFTSHQWQDAIEAVLQMHAEPGCTVDYVIGEMFHPTDLRIYERGVMDSTFVERLARRCVVRAVEDWSDEYGGEGGFSEEHEPFKTAAFSVAVNEVELAMAKLLATEPVWNCDQIGHVEITREEMAAIAREMWDVTDPYTGKPRVTP